MLVPVSPSGTGNTLRRLTSSWLLASQLRLPRSARLKTGPSTPTGLFAGTCLAALFANALDGDVDSADGHVDRPLDLDPAPPPGLDQSRDRLRRRLGRGLRGHQRPHGTIRLRAQAFARSCAPKSPTGRWLMAKQCAICGKTPQYGHHVSHAKNRVNRRFNPNLQMGRVTVAGRTFRAKVCTRCLRTYSV